MYTFTDTNKNESQRIVPAEALNINGDYIENIIPGYRTLYVSGREALSPEIGSFETGVRDGARFASRRFPARTITVGYQIIAGTNSAFREAYNKLGDVLNVEEALLIFNDEPDKFFVGTPSEITDVETGRNAVTGEFKILCADPFKYSVEEYEATPLGAGGTYVISDDFGGDMMTESAEQEGFYAKQILSNIVSDGMVELVGDGAENFVFGTDYKLVSETTTDENNETYEVSCVYVTEDLYNADMEAWSYKTTELLESQSSMSTFVVDYNGTYKSYPTLEVNFPEGTEDSDGQISQDACGFVAFVTEDKKIIQLGNPDEEDEDVVATTSKTSFYSRWNKNTGVTNWSKNTGVMNFLSYSSGSLSRKKWTGAAATHGSSNVGNLYVYRPSSYGSGATKKWQGVRITRSVPKDPAKNLGAKNCTMSWNQIMAMGTGSGYTKQLGRFCCWLVEKDAEGNRTVVAGAAISKASTGKTAKVYFYVNGKKIEGLTKSINLEKYNSRLGLIKKVSKKVKVKQGKKYKYKTKISFYNTKPIRTSTITKQNGKITFNIAGLKAVYTDNDIADSEVNEVTFTFGKYYGRTALTYNGLVWAKFVNAAYDIIDDVENTFSAGDELVADCESGTVYLNNLERPDLGALGNDWEDFCLEPGQNQIGAVWSDWAADKLGNPECRIKYREVYL